MFKRVTAAAIRYNKIRKHHRCIAWQDCRADVPQLDITNGAAFQRKLLEEVLDACNRYVGNRRHRRPLQSQ